jgi:hypothetical protein
MHLCAPASVRTLTAATAMLAVCAIGVSQHATAEAEASASIVSGSGQTIIDLNKVTDWQPLELEGMAKGAEIVVLKGDLKTASEVLIRTPANFRVPMHTHTSDETYVWIRGDFIYESENGASRPMSGQTFISLPGSAPKHALVCGKDPCLLYVRYSHPFDYIH